VRRYDDDLRAARRIATKQYRTLLAVDDLVGRLFRKLGRLDERRNTLAFFLSDNGYLWAEHRVINKRMPYEPSVRLPMFVRWPDTIPAGTTDERLVATVDIAPTVLEAAGLIDEAASLDGRSLLTTPPRSRLVLEFFREAGVRAWASTRTEGYQYIEWYEDDGAVAFREYYDLERDPWQRRNTLHDGDRTNNPETSSLSAVLSTDRGCFGPGCP
jgi:arylsulfatase A-like enzyme